jgi:hypothetical protein
MTRLSANQVADCAYRAGFRGQALTTAVAVALAESGGRTRIRGDTTITDGTYGPSVGLWQIRSLWEDHGTGRQRDGQANLDPATNARHAWQISHHGTSWHDWAAYTNGAYRAHLPVAQAAARHAASHPAGQPTEPAGHRGGHDRAGGPAHPHDPRPGGGAQRVVLDEAELTTLHAFFAEAATRIRHVRRVLGDVAEAVEPACAALADPALAGLIRQTFGYLESPGALPKAEERMDWHAQFAVRVRALVERADGADDAWSRPEMSRFRCTHPANRERDLATGLVLDALRTGDVRRAHTHLADHLHHDGDRHHTHDHHTGQHTDDQHTDDQHTGQSGHPLPLAGTAGLRNGHVPPSRLAPVGYGERLLRPVARQYLRMAAAARTGGVLLPLNDGYRSYAEQAELYRRYRNGTGNLAAPPGHSNHGLGLSVDIDTRNPQTVPWLRKHAAAYGFTNDVPSEPWHWTYLHH